MSSQKVLQITNTPPLAGEDEWRKVLAGLVVSNANNLAEAAWALSKDEFDCVLISGELGDGGAPDALELVHAVDPALPVIFWNPEMGVAETVRLIRAGAHYCLGYRDTLETLRDCLETAIEARHGKKRAQERAIKSEAWRSLLVGESRAMETMVETIRLIGGRRCTVLIGGETGTGKEMAARALHLASPRGTQSMVAINCSALPENLLEAELFGHVKGAFTGAIQTRVGRFEQAHRGTLFLDEIGDMPLELQAKLLRVLQDREIQRLGSSETIKVDVRVIAATNVNLLDRVRQGKFREDLYYRLNVVPLEMPPLRKREGDIDLLVDHFVKKICQLEGIPVKKVTPEALERLRSCAWPGNVRQLENAVEMAVAMSGERENLFAGDFGLAPAPSAKVIPFELPVASYPPLENMDFETAVSQFEKTMLERALEKTAGNKTAAAELLGLKRTTLIMKLRSYADSGALCAAR
ncbi:Transcriptional regulatory protein ZraR [Candidatus Sulfopaludibacter sp. SbA3]|nr:Transcriptional regulatory protein ZraR [Candidatus Sulfopaludibacter sp. SbA3]